MDQHEPGTVVTAPPGATVEFDHHDNELRGRVAIVTGASRGIGAATARRLAMSGACVVLASRSRDSLSQVAETIHSAGGTAVVVPTDVRDTSALDSLVSKAEEHFGRLDILVNNAGVFPPVLLADQLTAEDWAETFAVNVTAAWRLSCQARTLMAASGGGVVVNVSSTASLYPSIGLSAYCVSKAALNMLSRVTALEWARDGIRVVAIAPGKVDTELGQPVLAYHQRKQLPVNPMRRVADPGEVAELIAFVASDRAAYMTGNLVTFDGGETAGAGAAGAN
ncbi:SDR family oxidoreductase [Frankia sp. Cas4]|uniref:SDR family NAD(P)-dependent oxidoreductase n=1 Tax=Frankia sp. Cas4 TaxID=3073927 RepID=UPI002AD372F1|nr:SDR family oxidoreductase [Frankia sp. Cas4]